MASGDRELEIVVWGATGFTGRLVAEYLLRRYGTGDLRWALGGRNPAKLEEVRGEIARATGSDASGLPLFVGDSDDPASMEELAGRAKVVCTTVGPYAKYGSLLVAACAKAGTDYCDLTGEVHWIRRMIDAHQDTAAASGARLVPTSGFDSIPSDLGVWFVQREMQQRHGVVSPHVKCRIHGFSGGASGGTLASMMNMMDEAGRDPEVRRVMADPYGINPKDLRHGPEARDRMQPSFDEDFGQWTAPFVMAAINTRVVRRTNALLGYPYGQGFRYDEAILTGKGALGLAKASGVAAGMAGTMAAATVGPIRRLIEGRLPAPGEGPSKEQREKGYFDLEFLAEHPDDRAKDLRARVRGDRDPGYGSTSKMLAEAAVCLARDDLEVSGGFWTPASAMGDALVGRLHERAGVTFEVE